MAHRKASPVRPKGKADGLRVKKVLELSKFFGSGLWDGDLSGMREDQPRKLKRTKK